MYDEDNNDDYEKCKGIKCSRCPGPKSKKRAAIHPFVEEGIKKGSCLVHILPHERDIFKAARYEHAILNSVISSLKDDQVEEIIHDKVIDTLEDEDLNSFPSMSEIQRGSVKIDKKKTRPDLLIVGKNGSIVVVEVDENYHKNQEELDRKREKRVIWQLSDKYSRKYDEIHMVRIQPMENKKLSGMMTKPDKIVIKNNNFDDVMKVVNSKISKRLSGVSSPLTPLEDNRKSYSRKINPDNYLKYKSPEKRTFNTLLSETPVKNSKVSLDFKKSKTLSNMKNKKKKVS